MPPSNANDAKCMSQTPLNQMMLSRVPSYISMDTCSMHDKLCMRMLNANSVDQLLYSAGMPLPNMDDDVLPWPKAKLEFTNDDAIGGAMDKPFLQFEDRPPGLLVL